MMRRNINSGNGVATTIGGSSTNQENVATVRQKNVENVAPVPAARPPMRFALGEIKNTQHQQPLVRKTTSFKKTDDAAVKVEPRRPLRSNTLSNVPAAKNAKPCPIASSTQNSMCMSTSTIADASSTLTTSNNSTMLAVPHATAMLKTKVSLGVANAGLPKPRLLRSNAVSSLHSAAESVRSNDALRESEKSQPSDLVALGAALRMAPVREEPENVHTSPNRTNAYSSSMPSMLPNIDKDDGDNPQCATEYVNDIYDYLRMLEVQQPINENFLEGKEINGRMRGILVDWLSQVHVRFHLLPETLYMTVAMVDRFLQEVAIPKEKLQLLGVTAMFVASKYEEMYAPEIADFVYITDNSVSKHDVRVMECLILSTLKFKLGRPLPIHFLRRYSKAADADTTLHTLSKYFLELALVQYALAHFPPSVVAASALWLALKLLKPTSEWNDTMKFYSKYDQEDFQTCFRRLCRVVVRTHTDDIKQQAIRNKFSTSKFFEISKHRCIDLAAIRKFSGELL